MAPVKLMVVLRRSLMPAREAITIGTGFSLGHDDTNHPGMNPPTTITFTALPGQCTAANPCFFDLGFVSWQGTGTATVPEPGTLGFLATGLLTLGLALSASLAARLRT